MQVNNLPHTRGGLAPATVTNLINNDTVRCMFNPFEYTIVKRNNWKNKDVMGLNVPRVEFQQGGAATLQLTLHFDSQAQKTDVRTHTNPLWQMMMIDGSTTNAETGKSEPPPVAFSWGRLYFKAIITNMQQKFTLFDENGTPLRCEVSITMQQYADDEATAAQLPGMGAGTDLTNTATYVQGERLDNMILSKGRQSVREIAEKNGIDNPLKIQPGKILKL